MLDRAKADLQASNLGASAVWADPVKVGAIQHALKRPATGQEFKEVRAAGTCNSHGYCLLPGSLFQCNISLIQM